MRTAVTGAALSPTLAIHEEVTRRVAQGDDVLHLGFGEAGLPVHPLLREELTAAAGAGGYMPVAGEPALRQAIADYYARRRLETRSDQIVVGPGSKAILFALLLALDGDVVLPTPAWVSYAAQARFTGKRVVQASVGGDGGGVPEPEALEDALDAARTAGLNPRILLITTPDNPTGTVASSALLRRTLCVARANGLFVISDEIYRDLVHDGAFVSAAEVDETCAVTGGLSKSLALGGWRLGMVRLPRQNGNELLDRVCAVASEIWSCVAAPVARAARLAFEEPPELCEFVEAARMLHRDVVAAIRVPIEAAGGQCRPPAAAFYLYPDFERSRARLAERGIDSGTALAATLLDDFGIAVLPGVVFGDDDRALRFRVATSLLYGKTDEARSAALEAARAGHAGDLPEVRDAVRRLRCALEELLS